MRHRIPRLWAFFALSQILPISFAQNLFYIALLRSPGPKETTIYFPRRTTLLVTAAYCICLLVAPYTAEGPFLMPTIIVARLLLFVPFFLPEASGHGKKPLPARKGLELFDHWQARNIVGLFATAMTVKQDVSLIQQGYTLRVVWRALFSHPAVTSLGVDFVVTNASFAVWVISQSRPGRQKIAQERKLAR